MPVCPPQTSRMRYNLISWVPLHILSSPCVIYPDILCPPSNILLVLCHIFPTQVLWRHPQLQLWQCQPVNGCHVSVIGTICKTQVTHSNQMFWTYHLLRGDWANFGKNFRLLELMFWFMFLQIYLDFSQHVVVYWIQCFAIDSNKAKQSQQCCISWP